MNSLKAKIITIKVLMQMNTTMTDSILELWNNIAQSNEKGLFKRLIQLDNEEVYIYATFQSPEKYCGIAIAFDQCIKVDLSPFSNLRDLNVYCSPDSTFQNKNLLFISLLQYQSRDIFSVLCGDLIHKISEHKEEKKIVRIVINQLEKSRTLFDRMCNGGLQPAEQQGLYGELTFLQKFILKSDNPNSVINAWVGVDKEIRDFQFGNWAVEVKTTAGNNHQRVSINSERQLDDTLMDCLYLFHLSVETSKGNGENLNQKVQTVRNMLSDNSFALNSFNSKLLEAGYFDVHAHLYEERCYAKRDENIYQVKDDFPRIKENEIRNGVGDVKYTIVLSHCDMFLISESQLFNTLSLS